MYEISGGNAEGAFAVNSKTGDIYVDSPLDFETKQKVTISTPDKILIFNLWYGRLYICYQQFRLTGSFSDVVPVNNHSENSSDYYAVVKTD